jgi:transposase
MKSYRLIKETERLYNLEVLEVSVGPNHSKLEILKSMMSNQIQNKLLTRTCIEEEPKMSIYNHWVMLINGRISKATARPAF